MSVIAAVQWTAVATIALAVFAVVTAVFAFLAYRKQSKELRSIEAHMTDLRDWAGQETELLQVQFGQLDVLRQQFEEQRAVNARHTEVLELQAQELKASLEQHERQSRSKATRPGRAGPCRPGEPGVARRVPDRGDDPTPCWSAWVEPFAVGLLAWRRMAALTPSHGGEPGTRPRAV